MARSTRENVEIFHLLFLRVLGSGSDRDHYVVKGGCNLRFWLGSVRYSEDLDLDVVVTARQTLQRKVERMLEEGPLPTLLRSAGLRCTSFSAAKQTDTTQRWKLMLAADGIGTPFHTKIEFSRRPKVAAHVYGASSAELAARYHLVAPLAAHYATPAAMGQKVVALAHRVETQARDVFDLAHLLTLNGGVLAPLDGVDRKALPQALDRAMSVSYDDFGGQVVAFLEPEHRELYASRAAWDALQGRVVEALELASR